jgi:hypothetical protein
VQTVISISLMGEHVLTRSLLFLAALMLLCAGCAQVRQTIAKPVIGPSEGELFIYCEPFSQEADKLRFTVEAGAAQAGIH